VRELTDASALMPSSAPTHSRNRSARLSRWSAKEVPSCFRRVCKSQPVGVVQRKPGALWRDPYHRRIFISPTTHALALDVLARKIIAMKVGHTPFFSGADRASIEVADSGSSLKVLVAAESELSARG
jgi:hypothetical protein